MKLFLLPETYAIAKLPANAAIPSWAGAGLGAEGAAFEFSSITRTRDELSIVCADSLMPQGLPAERGRRALQVAGPLDFALTGILSALLEPLAEARISAFALSTYDTDYILLRAGDLAAAKAAWLGAGHEIVSL